MRKRTTHSQYEGKFAKPRHRSGKSAVLIVMLAFLALVLISLVGWMAHIVLAQKKYERLSARVENAATATVGPWASEATPVPPEPTVSGETTEPEETKPEETEPVILEKYRALYEENEDMVGWLKIDDTRIDYPVMYSPLDPEKYLHADFDGNYFFGGVPFVDANCTMDSDNLLIYGHNMLDGSMFRSLIQYENRSYWEKHPTIRFDTIYQEQEFEVLAAFYDRVYRQTEEDVFKFYKFIDVEDAADFDNAIAQFREKALYDTGVTANYGDQLITLVTCAYHVENGRFVVVARRMEPERGSIDG